VEESERLAALGMKTERRPAEGFGDHLVATTGVAGKQIGLGGHTADERVHLPSLFTRAALLTSLILAIEEELPA